MFDVGCSAFASIWPLNEIFSQILAAAFHLARCDFRRLNRGDVGRANITLSCAVLAVARSPDLFCNNCRDSFRVAQARALDGIRDFRCVVVAGAALRYLFAGKDVDLVFARLVGCGDFCSD